MTLIDSILSSLRAGETSRELSAAICVAAGYVPGVPTAKKVHINGTLGSPAMLFYQDGIGTEFCPIPDLLLDANACMAFEREHRPKNAKLYLAISEDGCAAGYMDRETMEMLALLFRAPTLCAAVDGAVLIALKERNNNE